MPKKEHFSEEKAKELAQWVKNKTGQNVKFISKIYYNNFESIEIEYAGANLEFIGFDKNFKKILQNIVLELRDSKQRKILLKAIKGAKGEQK